MLEDIVVLKTKDGKTLLNSLKNLHNEDYFSALESSVGNVKALEIFAAREKGISAIEICDINNENSLQKLALKPNVIQQFSGVFATYIDDTTAFEFREVGQCPNGMFYWDGSRGPWDSRPLASRKDFGIPEFAIVKKAIERAARLLKAYTGKNYFMVRGFKDNLKEDDEKYEKNPSQIEAMWRWAPSLEIISSRKMRKHLQKSGDQEEVAKNFIRFENSLDSYDLIEIPESCRYKPESSSIVIVHPSYTGTLYRNLKNNIPCLGLDIVALKGQKDGVRYGYGVYNSFVSQFF